MHPLFDLLVREITTDIGQMVEEGHDAAALLAELAAVRATGSLDALAGLQEELWRRPSPPEFPCHEPSDWESIAAGLPDADSHARFPGGDDDLADRLLAAWRGRCAGCQLGKIPEGLWPEEVEELLRLVGSWPLEDYLNALGDEDYRRLSAGSEVLAKRYATWRNTLTKGHFDRVAPDDDIHYAVIGQMILEQYGPDFTADQAIGKLIELSPASSVFASGRNMFRTYLFGLRPPHTAVFGNPCRQSLGAQIRCDPWGWAAPANPALAARMAYTGAASSQVRNGIYSGIFFAVLIADVLAHGEVARAIDTATAYVPPRSRFAEMVRLVRDRCTEADDWQQVNAAIYERYDPAYGRPGERAPMNHSLPNAAIVLMSLLMGRGDFGRTICIAVMAGRDTDCNAATAGSILGCAVGTARIPARWTDPFGDTIATDLKGLAELKISDLARRLHRVARAGARFESR